MVEPPQTTCDTFGKHTRLSWKVRGLDEEGIVSHMVLPHELFSLLHQQFPKSFATHLGADTTELGHFWANFLATKYGQHMSTSSLAGKTRADLSCCIPLIIHGDGVPYAHRQSAFFLQWGSLTGYRPGFSQASRSGD
jgi:hypothetical protein